MSPCLGYRLGYRLSHCLGHRLGQLLNSGVCALAALLVCASMSMAARAQSPTSAGPEDAPNTHNMLVFGQHTIYLSHLPMFDGVASNKMAYTSPHRYQVILAADFRHGTKALNNLYFADRSTNAKVRIYTLNPENFVLSRLNIGDKRAAHLTQFKATVFRGHLEKGGKALSGLTDIDVKVRVVRFKQFDPHVTKPQNLSYLLIGNAQETYLIHDIVGPPDFDQVLAVNVVDHRFTDAELRKGVNVVIPGQLNQAGERVKEAQQVVAHALTADAKPLKFSLKANREIYFEEGELRVPPTFDDTPLERAAAQ